MGLGFWVKHIVRSFKKFAVIYASSRTALLIGGLSLVFTLTACGTEIAREPKDQIQKGTPLYITYDNQCGNQSELNAVFKFQKTKDRLAGAQSYDVVLLISLTAEELAEIANTNPCILLIDETVEVDMPAPTEEPIASVDEESTGDPGFFTVPSPQPEPALPPPPPKSAPATFSGFNDPMYKAQHVYPAINAEAAYRILLAGPKGLTSEVKIGIIDNERVNANHPDLQGQLLPGSDTTTESSNTSHGQYVLGIMAAKGNNKLGTAGIAGVQAKFLYKTMPIYKNLSEGRATVDITKMANMLRVMGANGIDVINISLGIKSNRCRGSGPCHHPATSSSTLLKAMRDTATRHGTLFVVSAANASDDVPAYSSINDGIIVVGSVNRSKRLSDYSNYGAGVNLYAPDFGIYGLTFKGHADNSHIENGTSFTTPIVTGAAALIKGYLRQNGKNLTASELAALILRTNTPQSKLPTLNFGKAAQEAQKLVSTGR